MGLKFIFVVHHSSHCGNLGQCCLYGHTRICHVDTPETMIIHCPLCLKMTTFSTQYYGSLCQRLYSDLDILPVKSLLPILHNMLSVTSTNIIIILCFFIEQFCQQSYMVPVVLYSFADRIE